MPAHDTEITTVDALMALPDDGKRHELLAGEHVVTPAPRPVHQTVAFDLARILTDGTGPRDDLQVFLSPADLAFGPTTLVQPDVFVARKEPGSRIREWSDVGVPALVVEIVSPSTAARDRGKKRKIYQRAGVTEYWIVDIDARIVERWRPGDDRPEILDGEYEWPVGDGPPISLHVAEFFRSLPAID